jgi:uncharacterized protein (TIGR03083 family)
MPAVDVRKAFFDAAGVARGVLRDSSVAKTWNEPSALEHWSVAGVAGHLYRAIGSIEPYLDRPQLDGVDPVSPVTYYAKVLDAVDADPKLHVGIRQRGDEASSGGYDKLVDDFDALVARLRERLPTVDPGRLLTAFLDTVLTVDGYLATRIIECVVHTDDLAVSVGLEPPNVPAEAAGIAISALVEVARVRRGDLSVLRALTRRERDDVQALRVL